MTEARMLLYIFSFGGGLLLVLISLPLFISLGMPDPAYGPGPGWWKRLQCRFKGHDFPEFKVPVTVTLPVVSEASDNPFAPNGHAPWIPSPPPCERCWKEQEV